MLHYFAMLQNSSCSVCFIQEYDFVFRLKAVAGSGIHFQVTLFPSHLSQMLNFMVAGNFVTK